MVPEMMEGEGVLKDAPGPLKGKKAWPELDKERQITYVVTFLMYNKFSSK